MPITAAAIPNDHLEKILLGQGRMPSPLPLLTTNYDVSIRGGLACVTERRTFRNAEKSSIEATITFPVPVHAVVYGLELQIGERRLKAHCKKREQARDDYEDAIDTGKTAVLHEELLRGVHMLSVGHLPPGDTVTVTSQWATSLGWVAGRAQLRIPVTVGDVYGQSPLGDADDLVSGGTPLHGTLKVSCESGRAYVGDNKAWDGTRDIPLNRPIDICVHDWQLELLESRAADGRRITLDIAPAPTADAGINAAILVDRSGSMSQGMSAGSLSGHRNSKFEAVRHGLKKARKYLPEETSIDVWQFDDRCDFIATTHCDKSFAKAIKRIDEPGGGTEIGAAIERAIKDSRKSDLLVITDGKSYALDVQALAALGCRVSVVLVGEDSLEANIGHLAAITGGELFAAMGKNVGAVVGAALNALQRPQVVAESTEKGHVVQYRAGMTAAAVWGAKSRKGTAGDDHCFGRAIEAFATSMLMAGCEANEAAELAERAGIVCHLTSLVITDEAGERQQGLPATRKVPLMAPAASASPQFASSRARSVVVSRHTMTSQRFKRAMVSEQRVNSTADMPDDRVNYSDSLDDSMAYSVSEEVEDTSSGSLELDAWLFRLRSTLERNDHVAWYGEPDKILAGDLSFLPPDVVAMLRGAAKSDTIKLLARQLGLVPEVMVLGFLAVEFRSQDRGAMRLAKRIFGHLAAEPMRLLNEELVQRGHSGYEVRRDDLAEPRDATV